MKFENTCPYCGSHLVLKEGQFGEFLACPRFPKCQYTMPLPSTELKTYEPLSPYCEKCSHTGLLPFIKNNKIIPNAFIDCQCKIELHNHKQYIPTKPEDFDFPMSSDWRAYTYYYCGVSDPVPDPPDIADLNDRLNNLEAQPERQSIANLHKRLNQLSGLAQYNHNWITGRKKKRKGRREYISYKE